MVYSENFFVFWDTLALASRALPRAEALNPAELRAFIGLIEAVCILLPCGSCKEHALQYYVKHPPAFRTGDECFQYVVDWHNDVNVFLQKPVLTVVEAEAALSARLQGELKGLPRAVGRIKELETMVTVLKNENNIYRSIATAPRTLDDKIAAIHSSTLQIVNICIAVLLLIAFLIFIVKFSSDQKVQKSLVIALTNHKQGSLQTV